MKLSVVILNYNVRYFLEVCLKSVQSAISEIDAEIIVVDNNSKDDSCSMVKELFPEVILLENKENFGFSKGNNIGVKKAKGEYLCILNPDTVVAEDTFLKLLKFIDNEDEIGIVGCKLVDGTGKFLPESKRNIPYLKIALKKLIGNSDAYYANHLNDDDAGEVDIFVGAFMIMKKNVYDEVAGFDEDYFMYGEDIDLSYRILKSAYKNYYFGKTSVIHFKGESTFRDKNYIRRFYSAMQIFYKKHFKRNIFFDLFVFIGIMFASFFKKAPIKRDREIRKYVLISENMNADLQLLLGDKLTLEKKLGKHEHGTEIIFDAGVLTFKEIIKGIQSLSEGNGLTYKILPKNSRFILGSNDSVSRGEVITF
ncbi:glycosyltransferase family 2 protein [Seonamhaeicola sp. MEBiC1930]|uniref:glycosyltransferase family 2 protein n=1 Tax=Seonamhaeicola sp. MEBiC01930 TaxID=2976768 RepID=UPI0032539DE2